MMKRANTFEHFWRLNRQLYLDSSAATYRYESMMKIYAHTSYLTQNNVTMTMTCMIFPLSALCCYLNFIFYFFFFLPLRKPAHLLENFLHPVKVT